MLLCPVDTANFELEKKTSGDNIRPGYLGINVTVNIESTASDAEIDKLKDIVNAHCPVLDLFSNKTPVNISVNKKASSSNKKRKAA